MGAFELFLLTTAWFLTIDLTLATYQRFGRWITGTFGMLFGAAGIGILVARP